jgi:hypothetical protein
MFWLESGESKRQRNITHFPEEQPNVTNDNSHAQRHEFNPRGIADKKHGGGDYR